jgi:hypothetical protein
MIEQSLKLKTKKIKVENILVVYNLIFKNALYSLECYIEGNRNQNDYCFIENITEDEGEAEFFLEMMSKGRVLPVHIKDMKEDYFGKTR